MVRRGQSTARNLWIERGRNTSSPSGEKMSTQAKIECRAAGELVEMTVLPATGPESDRAHGRLSPSQDWLLISRHFIQL